MPSLKYLLLLFPLLLLGGCGIEKTADSNFPSPYDKTSVCFAYHIDPIGGKNNCCLEDDLRCQIDGLKKTKIEEPTIKVPWDFDYSKRIEINLSEVVQLLVDAGGWKYTPASTETKEAKLSK